MGEVKVWSHNVSLTFYPLTSLSFHVNGPFHSWDTTFFKFDPENPRSMSWKRWTLKIPSCVQHSIASHPILFHVNRPSHSKETTLSKFDLENPRSRSLVRWTSNVTSWVEHSIDSHLFRCMSIGHPIHKIRLFQNLTSKIQGQCHGWGERWSHNMGPTFYRLTPLSFHANRPIHSWHTAFSKFDLENPRSRSWLRSKLKVT